MPSTENFVKINVTVLGRTWNHLTFCVTEWRILEIWKRAPGRKSTPSSVSCHRKWGNFVVKGSQAGSGVHWECLHCLPTTIEQWVLGHIGCLDHWGCYKYQILNLQCFLDWEYSLYEGFDNLNFLRLSSQEEVNWCCGKDIFFHIGCLNHCSSSIAWPTRRWTFCGASRHMMVGQDGPRR